jgi:hypothetical protein
MTHSGDEKKAALVHLIWTNYYATSAKNSMTYLGVSAVVVMGLVMVVDLEVVMGLEAKI